MFKPIFFLVIFLLTGCGMSIEKYQGTEPEFDLKEFFNGEMVAYGLFQNYSGKVVRRFRIDMVGSWEGEKGTLKEDFFYDDGETQHRTWYITHLGEGKYQGAADDVIGDAYGQVHGFASRWQYTVALPYNDGVINVKFDDWMYLVDENRLLNRAKVKKWGFKVGEVLLYLEKVQPDSVNHSQNI